MKVKQLRNTLGRHLSVGSLVVVTDHNLPDLKRAQHKFTCLFLYIFSNWGHYLFEGGKKHLTSCIKKAKGVGFTPNHYSYCIVVKNLSQKVGTLVR